VDLRRAQEHSRGQNVIQISPSLSWSPTMTVIRPIALNRKNAVFAGSDGGGEHWAAIASLIETCKLNGVNPLALPTGIRPNGLSFYLLKAGKPPSWSRAAMILAASKLPSSFQWLSQDRKSLL
jgi:hypothetical protein